MLTMTETIADRYRRRASAMTDTIDAVPLDRWNHPSPCSEWKAVDVVRHLVDTQGMFAGFVGRQLEPGPCAGQVPSAPSSTHLQGPMP